MIFAYAFSLALGGVLLGASILLGGQDDADADAGGADFDADVDADVDFDADFDADADLDAGGGDLDHGTQALVHVSDAAHGDAAGFLTAFLSLRFWTFALTFFGLTGVVLTGLALASSGAAAGLAVAMGIGTGQGAVAAFRALGNTKDSEAATTRDYVGLTGRVLLGFGPGQKGKVRVVVKNTTVDLLATSDEKVPFETGDQALVVQLEGHTAIVAHVKDIKALEASA